jgi:NitT/TauT family transport system ATP-binding protein
MLEVDIAAKSYRSADGTVLHAIRDMSFSIGEGEFACLVGPSGCGKTTCLRILLGLEQDFSGHYLLPGDSPRIGIAFQEPRLLPWRTVDQNVRLALPAEIRNRPLGELYERLGLAGMSTFFPGELSLGLARRAALARAFAVEPTLLLLDEPFVSLDEGTAADLRGLLMDVWQARRTTALMVTHNLREAVQLADKIVILSPRPGTVRGIYEIEPDRRDRDGVAVTRIAEEIGQRFPGVV